MMKLLSKMVLRMLGWKLSGSYPDLEKSVMIMAPHTSMWDFVMGRLSIWAHGIRGRFMIKSEMFTFPLGPLLKALGGVPVDRLAGTQSFAAAVDIIHESKRIALIITPEGTRQKVEQWKRGFYTIAVHAGVPIVLGCLDYQEKVAYIGPVLYPCGDYGKDLPEIESFYRGRKGRHPERFNLP